MTDQPEQRVVIVGPDGRLHEPSGVLGLGRDGQGEGEGGGKEADNESVRSTISSMVSQPDKVMRIGTMIKQLLEEVRAAPLDDASRARLREIHRSSISELSDGLAPELREELDRLTLPFEESRTPSDAELRIAQAQLVGWLEGLFHGLQTALFAQQMAARAQLEEMRRRALPSGHTNQEGLGGGTYL
ncbi:bacterial proteasome activator family protein [Frankia sp. CNm7]|uniref:Bacterial proteasome activator n=1 Tax=Frankia nepalensis TaxID=1836974 RepID=A0A937RVS1_9ACTN|nr:bacterial proteasome activator family protein [Frankia nepalensis]MBL7496280.1 bacterial proteasome activator family protein [Frankia nepalensis]MBL7513828.1 bacterial proteasome activator family protein [Frankia nepalensis]MBL7517567.1 bacterial proteasome activator family protein [Frankia nepalensis]MBL7633743.1 bacterial proteasome activator family protein [Frankia nepalensis]